MQFWYLYNAKDRVVFVGTAQDCAEQALESDCLRVKAITDGATLKRGPHLLGSRIIQKASMKTLCAFDGGIRLNRGQDGSGP